MDHLGDDIVPMDDYSPNNRINGRWFVSLDREHLTRIKEWRNEQMSVLRQWKPLTDLSQEKWFEKITSDDTQAIFSIVMEDEGGRRSLIGYCGIVNIYFPARRGEISFLVDPKRGCDDEVYREDFISALYMLCRYGFDGLCLHKLYTETFSFRNEHICVLERFGFKLEGRMRDHQFIDGRYNDSLIHSILLDEWKDVKKEIANGLE